MAFDDSSNGRLDSETCSADDAHYGTFTCTGVDWAVGIGHIVIHFNRRGYAHCSSIWSYISSDRLLCLQLCTGEHLSTANIFHPSFWMCSSATKLCSEYASEVSDDILGCNNEYYNGAVLKLTTGH